MKRNKIVFILALAITMVASVYAQEKRFDREGNKNNDSRKEWRAEANRGNSKFGQTLTEKQTAAIKEIKLKSAKESKPLKFKLKELKAHHQTLINEDKPNLKNINANIDDMTKIKAQLEKIKAKSRVEVLAQLTEEQKLLFSEKKHKRGQAFKEGKRQGRPEGRNKEFMPF